MGILFTILFLTFVVLVSGLEIIFYGTNDKYTEHEKIKDKYRQKFYYWTGIR